MLTDTGVIDPNFTELRIYPSFTEIRQQFNAPQDFKMYFSRDVFNNISRGSLSIEGIPVLSKQIVTKANKLENQTVFVQRHTQEEPKECRVIQGDDLLLQDVKTNRYFLGQRRDLEYVTTPDEDVTEVVYALKQQGKATLSYQLHGISWSPRYHLNILTEDCQHIFEAFAEMTNKTKQEYKINRTELFGGDVLIKKEKAANKIHRRSRSISRSVSSNDEDDDNELSPSDIIPTIDTLGELAGLHFYSIDKPFIFLKNSTFCLPFINATIQLNKYVGLTLPFTKQTSTGKLQRKYCIESIDKFLPRGPLTIREQGRLVGSTNLPDMAMGDKHTLICGQDADVSFNRQIKLTSKKRDSAVYTVNLTFKNVKSIPMVFEYKEIVTCENVQFTIIPKGPDGQRDQIQSTVNGVQIESKDTTGNHHAILAANGGEQMYEYEIHLNYGNKRSSKRHRRSEEDDE